MVSSASKIRRAGLVVAIAVVVALGFTAARLWFAWDDISRVPFRTDQARAGLTGGNPELDVDDDDDPESVGPLIGGELATDADTFSRAVATTLDEALDVFLIIGSDARSETEASRRADVILLLMIPTDGHPPILSSVPRDLYLPNPCTGGMSRINANLNGCGAAAGGPEQLAVAVEDFTGVPIDHFAVFDFAGFTAIVDRVGGVEICVPHAVRDEGVDPIPLSLPGGCTNANGTQALAWVRSRKTEGLIDGTWQKIGANDLTRNARQQDLIVQALSRLSTFKDISELTALVEQLASLVTIDEGLGIRDAVATAWSLRGTDPTAIVRIQIPVADYVDPRGRFVLVPRASFSDLLREAAPDLAGFLVDA